MPEVTSQANGPINLLYPLRILALSAFYLIPTLWSLLLSFDVKRLTSIEEFKDAWFAKFWAFFGPRSAEVGASAVLPLLRHNAKGVCLDIGPGSGQWLPCYSKVDSPEITKIYGVEPNPGMHAALRAKIREVGLEGTYEIIGCGAEEVGMKGGIQRESIDTIITVQCLCSIPTPEKVIRELYPLLKPGGKWLVYEHVRTKYQNQFVGYWQSKFAIVRCQHDDC